MKKCFLYLIPLAIGWQYKMQKSGVVQNTVCTSRRLPPYLLKKVRLGGPTYELKKLLRSLGVNTVCESARCPNISECFEQGELTFMIMGTVCTRNCGFCGVASGEPLLLDHLEPEKVAAAACRLKLKYIVVTSVTRDDLDDGGAAHFAACIRTLREKLQEAKIEVLVPDFRGRRAALKRVIAGKPDVLAHNIETVERLYPLVRPGSNYERSLGILRLATIWSPETLVKSGFMVGLGETDDEIYQLIRDIRSTGCSMLTIGHYLPPTVKNLSLVSPHPPGEFQKYREQALDLGFKSVKSGIFVRSSYQAYDQMKSARRDQ